MHASNPFPDSFHRDASHESAAGSQKSTVVTTVLAITSANPLAIPSPVSRLLALNLCTSMQSMNLLLDLDHGVGCAFSPDDKFVAVAMSRSREIKVYKTKGAKEGAQVRPCDVAVCTATVSRGQKS